MVSTTQQSAFIRWFQETGIQDIQMVGCEERLAERDVPGASLQRGESPQQVYHR